MRPQNYQKVFKSFVCSNAVIEYATILAEVLLNKELKDTVVMSFSKAKQLTSLENGLYTGPKINWLGVREIDQDILDLFEIYNGGRIKKGCAPLFACLWINSIVRPTFHPDMGGGKPFRWAA